jgi:hypothetical protein
MARVNLKATALSIAALLPLMVGCSGGSGELPQEPVDQASEQAATGVASTKATAVFDDIAILQPTTSLGWTSIMTTQIKTSNQKTLFLDASFECGLLTQTTVKSKGGTKDTSTASAAVLMQVLVDGVAASPGVVTYCQRTQQLSATLAGILQQCTDTNGDGVITASECQFTDEQISLLLSTMGAASFNFIANVGTGVHNITVQAEIRTSTSTQAGSAVAEASIGKGSLVVTEQRL